MVSFNEIAQKWQQKWSESKIFEADESGSKKKYYCLEMFPYPSSMGLHMGHARNYVIGDMFARYKRMNGFNVLYPMGFDSFGLPAENAAIKAKSHPKIFTEKAISNFIKQQKSLGLSYDWSRTLASHKPEYYRWDQWIFLQLFKKGLAYKKTSIVNWCSKCETVLANEQVVNGCCWRHDDTEVDQRELNQWYFKITDYAERLLQDLDKLDWPEDIKQMQSNWIGKSYGAELWFDVVDEAGKKIDTIKTFTTRPDTAYGITYLVLACEHPKVIEYTKGTEYEQKAKDFITEVKKKSIIERTAEGKEKNGMFLGKYFINPFTGEKCPLWIADYALYDYGTGAVMAVPAHDQRDFEFAKKYDLPIKVVINPHAFDLNPEKMTRAFVDEGTLVNSGDFDDSQNRDAIDEITKFAEKKGWGKKTVNYKLRDWLISRQRFWGCPIPIINCEKCEHVPVEEKNLPVKLPENVTFGKGNPLETSPEFVEVICPKCGGPAKRETDTMDTFVDSSWYYMRYCDAQNQDALFDPAKVNYWLPIDLYVGGKEHATGHLIYFRFFTKFLHDLGLVNVEEPAKQLFNQGMLHKEGVVMSKSRGNVVLPEEVSDKYGIDTGRLFLMFVASPEKDMEWDDHGVQGAYRFIRKFYDLIETKVEGDPDEKELSKLNSLIKNVTKYYESLEYNKAIIELMQFTNHFHQIGKISKVSAENLVRLIGPCTPHICEELWEKLGNKPFVSLAEWPKCNESKINPALEAEDVLVEQVRGDILRVLELVKLDPKKISLIISPQWKYGFYGKLKQELEKSRDFKALIGIVMDKDHGQDIPKIIQAVLKDAGKMPTHIFSQDHELKILEAARQKMAEEFKAEIVLVKAEDSKEAKANNAAPGKPAIIIS
ncbi:MAG: leucine--tRNA ligase [Nanoarchaeota archaeon]|nr:leucine--tRNA ligase [Nanoarchaeota archaeon]